MFSVATWLFIVVAAAAAGYGYWDGGAALVAETAADTGLQAIEIAPQLAFGLLIGAFGGVLLPREFLVRWIGAESGFPGIVIASIAGALMPGGPFASFPIVHALHRAGANTAAVVAFLVAWASIGVSRLFVWEIPFMGAHFGVVRLICTIPLPLIAGLTASFLIRRYPGLDAHGRDVD